MLYLAVLTYGCESWNICKVMEDKFAGVVEGDGHKRRDTEPNANQAITG